MIKIETKKEQKIPSTKVEAVKCTPEVKKEPRELSWAIGISRGHDVFAKYEQERG